MADQALRIQQTMKQTLYSLSRGMKLRLTESSGSTVPPTIGGSGRLIITFRIIFAMSLRSGTRTATMRRRLMALLRLAACN